MLLADARPAAAATHEPAAPREFALWNLGFRPFYLLASAFASLSILLWVGEYTGLWSGAYERDPVWQSMWANRPPVRKLVGVN